MRKIDGKIIDLSAIVLKSSSLLERAETVRTFLENKNYEGFKYQVVIEEPLLSFRRGASSAKTIATLNRFNGIVSYLSCMIFGIEPIYIVSSRARGSCGFHVKKKTNVPEKMQVFQQVIQQLNVSDADLAKSLVNEDGTPVEGAADAVDAYVVAKASLFPHSFEKPKRKCRVSKVNAVVDCV